MLKIKNVSKTYGDKKVKAVDDIHFEVRPGEIFGFVGPNGAGKTTTIKMIVTLLKPDSGQIFIGGVDNARISWAPSSSSAMCRIILSFLKRSRGSST